MTATCDNGRCASDRAWHHVVCPANCSDTCSALVRVEDGRIVEARGDEANPHTRGFLCGKFNDFLRRAQGHDRIETPLVRTAAGFEPIGWDDALNMIVERWQGIIAEYGAEAILPYSYSSSMGIVNRNYGDAFFAALGASSLRKTLCYPARNAGLSRVLGGELATAFTDVEKSGTIVLWGADVTNARAHLIPVLHDARRRGAQVWLIDVYESPTARLADRTLCVKPGTDAYLALGVIDILLRKRLHDADFCTARVEGLETLRESVLARIPAEHASELCGVPMRDMEELAHNLAAHRNALFYLGCGFSRTQHGGMASACIAALGAVAGIYAREGGGIAATSQAGAALPLDPITRPDLARAPRRGINAIDLGRALLEEHDPPIRSLYVYGTNPAVVTPDQTRVLEGLARDDLFVVVHEQVMTDTARMADLILPATTAFEHDDAYKGSTFPTIQLGRACIEPYAEARSNNDVFRELARRLGMDEAHLERSDIELVEESIAASPYGFTEDELHDFYAGKPVVIVGERFARERRRDSFATPSGKVDLTCIYTHANELGIPWYEQQARTHGEFAVVTVPGKHVNSSGIYEDEGCEQTLLMNQDDFAERGLVSGQRVRLVNEWGAATFSVHPSEAVPTGVLIVPGLMPLTATEGGFGINALCPSYPTDLADASTYSDIRADMTFEK